MYYWRKDYFESLRELGADAVKFPEWTDYFAYCALLERGLRKEAFAKLNLFILVLLTTPFEPRRRFVSWLYHRVWRSGWLDSFVPHPLRSKIVEPTLREWIDLEPSDAEPHCWLGTIDSVRRAVALDPQSEVACSLFIHKIVDAIEFATYELPTGYLGDDPLTDLTELAIVARLLVNIRCPDERAQLMVRIAQVKELLDDYIQI